MSEKQIGSYRILDELGAGGMGTVYRGTDSRNQQTVAIKQLKSELTEPEMIERFKREGEALRDLNHPNIVKLLDTLDHDGQYYLVMEYVPGGDLRTLLQKGQMPIKRVLRLAIDLADALTRAHKLDIIHRDLKPANVLIGDDGTLRLTDFGVAHVGQKERMTGTGMAIGTLDYLSPESLNGEEVDARTDIWAFGVLLYEMLTGERPFSQLTEILIKPPPDIEQTRKDCPVALADLIYRMLVKDRSARIRSIRQVGLELEDILYERDTTDSALPNAGRFDTPAPMVFDRPKHNLPAQTSPFVGRESELAELSKLLENPKLRLLTILAPGGMGKTRLALELAGRYVGDGLSSSTNETLFSDGVYFVELAPLTAADQIVPTIANALEFAFQQEGRDQKQQLLDYLRMKQMFLVLDNYEHLMDGAGLVTEIIKAAPNVQIIATSRQRLAQSGETLFHLSGMDFPEWETPEDALKYAAVKLFVNSAQRAQPEWELTQDNLDYVARICRLVQGIPLGIVLAAAWLAMLSVEEIAAELEQSIDILSDELGDLPARQQSIRVVMDYSWQMMTEAEQAVFMQLAVFRKGFTREAAQAVAGANLRVLMALVNKSLIWRDADTGRYEIHEMLREYAQEQIEAVGEVTATQDKHAVFYSSFLAQQLPLLKGGGQIKALDAISVEFENCQAAWDWGVEQKLQDVVNVMIDSLYLYCLFHYWSERGQTLFQQARDQWPADSENAPLIAGRLSARFPATHDAATRTDIFERALAIAQRHEDPVEIAFCQRELGLQVGHRSEHTPEVVQRGLAILEEALDSFRALGDRYYEAHVLDDLGWCHARLSDRETRLGYSEQSIALRKEVGDLIGLGASLTGYVLQIRNDEPEKALSLIDELVDVAVQTRNRIMLVEARGLLGLQTYAMGELDRCWEIWKEIYAVASEINHDFGLTLSQLQMAHVICLKGGDYDEAYRLIKSALPDDSKMFQDSGYLVNGLLAYLLYHASKRDYTQLDIRFSAFVKLAFQFNLEPSREALAIMPIAAMVYAHRGQQAYAGAVLEMTLNHEFGLNPGFRNWPALHDLQTALRQELGDAAYDAAWEQGKSLDFATTFRKMVEDFTDATD